MDQLDRKDLWLATHNKDKIKEFYDLLEDLPFQLRLIEEFSSSYAPPEETGKTFLANALIKMNSFKKEKPGEWILAEDGGIEVDALDKRPGVYSARYYSPTATWPERLQALLKEMEKVPEHLRTAQMTSVIAVSAPDHKVIQAKGVVSGSLAFSIRGCEGFAYDWVFIPKGHDQTIGELGYPLKNKFSHRYKAVEELKTQLKQYFNQQSSYKDSMNVEDICK